MALRRPRRLERRSTPCSIPRVLALALAFLAACGGGGGGGSSSADATGGFELTKISVPDGSVWQINRPIELTFNRDVDFDSVNGNTIAIKTAMGVPAFGTFELLDPRRVSFQPTCPTQPDYSDAGFAPGAVTYEIRVLGSKDSSLTVLSQAGEPVSTSQTRTFVTPLTLQPSILFLDPVVGPPAPVLRPVGSSDPNATHLEVGTDASSLAYFEYDAAAGTITQPSDVPLNLYSDPTSRIAFVLELNQPVDPSATNIATSNVYLEYEATPGAFERLPCSVRLERNCTETGATVRLEPLGVLPQGAVVRAVITPAFRDLVGETNLVPIADFASVRPAVFADPLLAPPDALADELFEDFVLAGSELGSFEDTEAPFAEPRAIWGDGVLRAAFDFTSDGGPGGDFDFYVPSGETVVIGTTLSTVFGGPTAIPINPPGSGVDSAFTTIVNGRFDVRNLRIETGGRLVAIGPNPLRIQATGRVDILGELSVAGNDASNVATLNTGHQPEPGAAGNAGGGAGGTASYLTTTSTPKGGDGFGPFMAPNLGGRGGDSGFATGSTVNRRPGGGGGGRFGLTAAGGVGLTVEPGNDGHPNSTSAITFTKPARGGLVGSAPFIDEASNNDFLGTLFLAGTGELIVGELKAVYAGGGGGAGGDSIPNASFPSSPWSPASDDKGAGGGGGAGGLQILALDDILIGGRILADGGRGAAGEGLDNAGGGSGGGSGGHVVLQGNRIDFTGSSSDAIDARGGRGGPGQGGSFDSVAAGGDGGPGIIQIHATQLVLPGGATLANRTAPDAIQLDPIVSPVSRARSKWIALGGAAHDPDGPNDQVTFRFGGIDPLTGLVADANADELVDELPALLAPTTLASAPALPHIAADGRTLRLDGTTLAPEDDVYLRNPNLLQRFAIRLSLVALPATSQRFDVAAAAYDATTQVLALTVSSTGPSLSSFEPGNPVAFELLPLFFRLETSNQLDRLPADATVRLRFQGAREADGAIPDELDVLVDWTSDIGALAVPEIAFFRFEVEFDIDALGTGLSGESERPGLLFTRFPFRF